MEYLLNPNRNKHDSYKGLVNFSDIKLMSENSLLVQRKLNKTVPKINSRHPAVMIENREIGTKGHESSQCANQ